MKLSKILQLFLHCIMFQIAGLLILAAARAVMLYRFGIPFSDLPFLFFRNAARFDLQIIAYISAPAVLLSLIAGFTGSDKAAKLSDRSMSIYFAFMYAVMTLLAFGEFLFMDNFGTRYSSVFFDFADENPASLLLTIWQDYPIAPVIAGMAVAFTLVFLLGVPIARTTLNISFRRDIAASAVSSLLILAVTFIMMRGSLTSYTLQPEAFVVSDNAETNECVPNSIYMLKKAFSERKKSFRMVTTRQLLGENGFNTLEEAVRTAGYEVPAGLPEDSLLMSALLTESRYEPDAERPDIVLILSESWSEFISRMDSRDGPDLLGSLREHLETDITVRNFQSVRSGTIYTVETITTGMPYERYFKSQYRFNTLETAFAKPFKENGYATSFIVGFDQTWENVEEGLSHQYFDHIYGKQHILRSIPGSTSSLIGAYDEYLFDFLMKRLDEGRESGQPQLIIALTSTNHPPYTFPENMDLPPLGEEWFGSRMLTGDRDVLAKNGTGIQYANRSLGNFLTELKTGNHAGNTIVVATGDHNVRSILNFQEDAVPDEYRYRVPLYIYLPEKYSLPDSIRGIVSDRYGCHLDILPTLAPFAFGKGTKYLNIGHNLLDSGTDDLFFSYHESGVLSPCVQRNDSLMRVMKTRELLMKIYVQSRIHREVE